MKRPVCKCFVIFLGFTKITKILHNAALNGSGGGVRFRFPSVILSSHMMNCFSQLDVFRSLVASDMSLQSHTAFRSIPATLFIRLICGLWRFTCEQGDSSAPSRVPHHLCRQALRPGGGQRDRFLSSAGDLESEPRFTSCDYLCK